MTEIPKKKTPSLGFPLTTFASKELRSYANMKKYLILAAVISTVITSPLPDVQSAEQQQQQQWGGDEPIPFLLSTVPNDQLIASSNSQNGAQTGFELTNAVELSMPFAMDLQQIGVGGGSLPSIQSNEVVNPLTSFDVAPLPDLFSSSTIPPSTDPGLTEEAISGSTPGSDSSNKGTAPAAGSSSSPPPATAPASLELPPAPPGSNFDQAPLDMNSLLYD